MNTSTAKLEPIGDYRRPWFPPPIKQRVNPFLLPTQASTPLANTPPSTELIVEETLATPVSSNKTRYQSFPSPTIESINTPEKSQLSTPQTILSPSPLVKKTPKPSPVSKTQTPTSKDLREKAKQIGFARYWKLKKNILKEFIEAYERTGIIPEQVRSLKRVGVTCDFDTECYSRKCNEKKCDSSRVRKAIKPRAPLPPTITPKATAKTNPKKKQAKETLASCVITCVSKHDKQRHM